nr:hypothetical protein [Tanacetum cinerariifolium]
MVHHHSIWFKMDNKKRIVKLEYFREMMHICPRHPGQTFDDLLFEEEILEFLRFLGHIGETRKLIDGLYHKKNVDFAYLLWEDFVYQVEHKDAKKSNEMYYPGFTKVIIHYFMTKDPSIPRRNKVKWHYVRDDQMFTTIKLVSRHQNTQQFGVMLPTELTNEEIKNSKAYKEYYAVASGVAPPKTKASVRKTKSSSNTSITPPTAAGTRLLTSPKGKQPAKASKPKSLTMLFEVAMTEAEQLKLAMKRSLQQTHISQASDDDDDEGSDDQDNDDDLDEDNQDDDDDQDEGDDDDDQDEGNDDQHDSDEEGEEFIHPKLSIHDEEETKDEESFDPVAKTPENSDDEGIDSLFETTSQMDVQVPTTVASLTLYAPTLTPSTIATISTVPQAPTPPTTASSTLLQDLPNFGLLFGFDHRLKRLKANFSEFVQTNQFAGAVSSILENIQRYMDQRMNEAVKFAGAVSSILENIQRYMDQRMNEAVKVKIQVSKILPKIEKTVNEQLEAEVLTRSSNSSKTSYVVADDLSEMELKKILIKKIEGNKSIHRYDEQKNLYKALVEAYKSNKIILDTYEDIVTLKRRRDDDADKDEEPSAGSDRGSKRRREGKEPESTSTPKEKATKITSKSTQGSKSQQKTASESAPAEEPMQTTHDLEEPSHQEFVTDTLTPELLVGPTYELMKGSCKSLVELEFFLEEVYKATTDQLDWNNLVGQQYPHNLLKRLPLIPTSRGRHVTRLITSSTTTSSIYVEIVKWHNYKHLDWITVHRNNDKLYKFKKGDFKRIHIQDIKDMLLLLVQGKLTNLTVEERFAFNVSLRMFTRSIVIQRHVEDLQLGVESYQKKLNLTRIDMYRSDLKCKEAYTAYSNPRGFIYQNKDKQNRLMRIDELHKFSNETLNDVRTALG